MATAQSIAKAQVVGAALKQITGYPVNYTYHNDYVAVEWSSDDVAGVRESVQRLISSGPGDVRINFTPVILPYIIKNALPFVVGFGALCFYLGRISIK